MLLLLYHSENHKQENIILIWNLKNVLLQGGANQYLLGCRNEKPMKNTSSANILISLKQDTEKSKIELVLINQPLNSLKYVFTMTLCSLRKWING